MSSVLSECKCQRLGSNASVIRLTTASEDRGLGVDEERVLQIEPVILAEHSTVNNVGISVSDVHPSLPKGSQNKISPTQCCVTNVTLNDE